MLVILGVEPRPLESDLMSSDDRLDLEFAYTTYQDSCRDLYSPHYYCRRPVGHDDVHAAGFGPHRLRWEHQPDHRPHKVVEQ
jgi:hypothetical protein